MQAQHEETALIQVRNMKKYYQAKKRLEQT